MLQHCLRIPRVKMNNALSSAKVYRNAEGKTRLMKRKTMKYYLKAIN